MSIQSETVRTPKLRFPEYSSDWTIKKLFEISDVRTGPFGSSLHQEDYVESGTPIITVEHLGETGITTNNLPFVSDYDRIRLKSFSLKEGDIVFSRVGSVDRACITGKKENGWLFSGRLLRIRLTNNDYIPSFINQYFKNSFTRYRIRSAAVGQTMPSLNTKILKNFHLRFPPLRKEQEKIASFLTSVDSKIEKLSKKQELLREYKKGLMQKIFSQELRFKADDGSDYSDWEEKKLGDVCKITVGGTPDTSNNDYWNGNIPWLASGKLKNGNVTTPSKYITKLGLENSATKLMPSNTVLLAMTGATLGKIGFLKFSSTGNQSIAGFLPNVKYESKFLFYSLNYGINQVFKYAGGAAQQGINKQTILGLRYKFPDIKEQTKIANFLSSIDSKIEQIGKQLDETKEFKKALLQQMFV